VKPTRRPSAEIVFQRVDAYLEQARLRPQGISAVTFFV